MHVGKGWRQEVKLPIQMMAFSAIDVIVINSITVI